MSRVFSLLAFTVAACLVAVIPVFIRSRERALAWICAVQIVVLAVAASGWLGPAH